MGGCCTCLVQVATVHAYGRKKLFKLEKPWRDECLNVLVLGDAVNGLLVLITYLTKRGVEIEITKRMNGCSYPEITLHSVETETTRLPSE
jgi:hypothetical protein